jgi:hypothetical protein
MWRLPCGLRRRIGIRVRRWSAIRYGSRLGRRISLTIRWVWRIRRIGRVGWIRRRRSCATRRSSGKRLVRAIRCLASGRLSRCRRRSGWLRQWRWRSGLCRWWRGWRRRSRPHRWSCSEGRFSCAPHTGHLGSSGRVAEPQCGQIVPSKTVTSSPDAVTQCGSMLWDILSAARPLVYQKARQ